MIKGIEKFLTLYLFFISSGSNIFNSLWKENIMKIFDNVSQIMTKMIFLDQTHKFKIEMQTNIR